jgi:fimbrial chaperone protein
MPLFDSLRRRLHSSLGLLLAGITSFLLMLVFLTSEASMQVSPTQIFVAAEHHAAGLTLLNTSGTILYAQIRVFEWRQHDGEDQLVSTRSIVASPPMLKLSPGVSQLVRIVRNGLPPTSIETSYRIIVDEIPIKADIEDHALSKTDKLQNEGLKFRLRYSIPVFLAPSKQIIVQPILNTRLIKDKGKRYVHISNEGNGHAQLTDIAWVQGEQRITIASGLAGYVLPGQQRQWLLPDSLVLIKGGAFMARINGELMERILVSVTASD